MLAEAQIHSQQSTQGANHQQALAAQREKLREQYRGFTFTAKQQADRSKIAQDRETVMQDQTLRPEERDYALKQLQAKEMGIKPSVPPPPDVNEMVQKMISQPDANGDQFIMGPKGDLKPYSSKSLTNKSKEEIEHVRADTKLREDLLKQKQHEDDLKQRKEEADAKLELASRAKAIAIAQRANGSDDNGKPIPPTDDQIQAVQDKLQPSKAKPPELTPHQQAHQQGMIDGGHPNPPPYFKHPDDPGFSDLPDGSPFVDGLGRTRIKNGSKAPPPGPQDLNTAPPAGGLPAGDQPEIQASMPLTDPNGLPDDSDGSDEENSADDTQDSMT